jgi:hypothetical protein
LHASPFAVLIVLVVNSATSLGVVFRVVFEHRHFFVVVGDDLFFAAIIYTKNKTEKLTLIPAQAEIVHFKACVS